MKRMHVMFLLDFNCRAQRVQFIACLLVFFYQEFKTNKNTKIVRQKSLVLAQDDY